MGLDLAPHWLAGGEMTENKLYAFRLTGDLLRLVREIEEHPQLSTLGAVLPGTRGRGNTPERRVLRRALELGLEQVLEDLQLLEDIHG
jgi:hypothetical protein